MIEVIASIKHPAVATARADIESGASFLIEGRKLVLDALSAKAPLQSIFFLQPLSDRDVWEAAQQAGIGCSVVTRGVFSRIVELKYEPATRIVATVRTVRRSLSELLAGLGRESIVLIGENIQDPRNVGVLIRTADAWGAPAVAFTAGAADPFSRAAIRASTGSILRVGVTTGAALAELVTALHKENLRVIGTSAGADTAVWDADLSPPLALLLGNETTGLSPAARERCDLLVRIPMSGGAHSFNVTVAAGIVLYEAARQRAKR